MANLVIGASTMFFRNRPVAIAIEEIAKIGYTSAEVWIEQMQWNGERPKEVARRARALGLHLTAHASSYDLNPTSANLGIAQESRRQVEHSLEMAAELGASVLAVHPGRLTSSRDVADDVWARLLDWIGSLDASAQRVGVPIGVELMEKRPKEIFMTPADAARLMANNWRQITLTVDLAHTNTLGDPVSFLEEMSPEWIGHVHLSDNSSRQTHLPLGEGEIPLARVLAALEAVYSGVVNLEGYVPGNGEAVLAQNLDYLRRIGFA